jgi:transposase
MEESKLYRARVQVVESMEQGLPWHEAAKLAGLQISQTTAYRLRQRMRQGGEQALHEGRHGHPIKLRGEARKFLEETCRQAPHTPSHEIQTQLAEQFTLTVSVSQINRVRATLGVSNRPNLRKKKTEPTHDRARVAGRGGRIVVAGRCPRNQPPLPVGSSPANQAGQFKRASALTTRPLPLATEPLAHTLVSAGGRTPPALGFTQLYRTGTRLVDRSITPIQLSPYRTLPAAAFYRPS